MDQGHRRKCCCDIVIGCNKLDHQIIDTNYVFSVLKPLDSQPLTIGLEMYATSQNYINEL